MRQAKKSDGVARKAAGERTPPISAVTLAPPSLDETLPSRVLSRSWATASATTLLRLRAASSVRCAALAAPCVVQRPRWSQKM